MKSSAYSVLVSFRVLSLFTLKRFLCLFMSAPRGQISVRLAAHTTHGLPERMT